MKIALIPCDAESSGKYLDNIELPLNYMGDFTLMGLVVDNYQEALTLLISSGFQLDEQEGGSDICIDSPRHISEIKTFLTANNIRCDLSDIADTFYQA